MTGWVIHLEEDARLGLVATIDGILAELDREPGRPASNTRKAPNGAVDWIGEDGTPLRAKMGRRRGRLQLRLYARLGRTRWIRTVTEFDPPEADHGTWAARTRSTLLRWRSGLAAATNEAAREAADRNSERLAGLLTAALMRHDPDWRRGTLFHETFGEPVTVAPAFGGKVPQGLLYGARPPDREEGGITPGLYALFEEGLRKVVHVFAIGVPEMRRFEHDQPESVTIGRHPQISVNFPGNPVELLRMLSKLPELPCDALLLPPTGARPS